MSEFKPGDRVRFVESLSQRTTGTVVLAVHWDGLPDDELREHTANELIKMEEDDDAIPSTT